MSLVVLLFPKSVVNLVNIGGTSPEDSRATFHWVLGSKLKEYCGGTVDPNDVSISYVAGNANGSAMITFMSPNGYRQISLNDIISEAKADLTQAGNTTYDPPAGEATTMVSTQTEEVDTDKYWAYAKIKSWWDSL